MRKIYFILIILFVSLVPLFAGGESENLGGGTTSSSESVSGTSALSTTLNTEDYTDKSPKSIETKLTAGVAKGTFVGFSEKENGENPITSLELKLSNAAPTTEIDSLTADGEFYVYWIIRSNTESLKITLKWDTSKGVYITAKKGGSTGDVFENGEVTTITDSDVVGSSKFYIVTEDLLDKLYDHDYTINFTVTIGSAS